MVLGVLFLAACGKSDGGGGASSDPKKTVEGFITAMAAGDLDKAKTFLMGEAACDKAPAAEKERCLDSVKKQRDRLSDIADEYPKGAKVKSVTPTEEGGLPPGVGEWLVILEVDGKDVESGALTMEYGGKHYATFAMRADD
jgi:hypothetical protein